MEMQTLHKQFELTLTLKGGLNSSVLCVISSNNNGSTPEYRKGSLKT